MIAHERQLEDSLIRMLCDLKYVYRPDIRDRATLEANFRQHFEALNRVTLTDGEFDRQDNLNIDMISHAIGYGHDIILAAVGSVCGVMCAWIPRTVGGQMG